MSKDTIKKKKKSFMLLRNLGFEDYGNILIKIIASIIFLEIDQLLLKSVWEHKEP